MNENFPRSFLPKTLRTYDAECGHKGHCTGVVREVIGYLELRAKDDPERFVWPRVDHIVDHCTHCKGGPHYSERIVKAVLAFLRRRHAISHRLKRRRNGAMREGFIVTPHNSLFKRTKNLCEFVGRLKAPGKWRRDPETRSWYWVPKGLL